MFGNSHLDRVRQVFADQFSPVPDGYVYRRGQKGAAYRVTSSERDQFVAAFDKRVRYATWSIFPATVGVILLLAWLLPAPESSAANTEIWIGLAAILLPFMSVFYWAWFAPSRELRLRMPEGVALTKAEARVLAFSRIGYKQLILAAVMGVGLVWKMSAKTDVLHGGGIVWLAFGAGLVTLSGVQAFRKWNFTRRT